MITEGQPSAVKQITGKYLQDFERLVHLVDVDAIERIAWRLASARDGGNTVLVSGNGGSAAIASHRVNDQGN